MRETETNKDRSEGGGREDMLCTNIKQIQLTKHSRQKCRRTWCWVRQHEIPPRCSNLRSTSKTVSEEQVWDKERRRRSKLTRVTSPCQSEREKRKKSGEEKKRERRARICIARSAQTTDEAATVGYIDTIKTGTMSSRGRGESAVKMHALVFKIAACRVKFAVYIMLERNEHNREAESNLLPNAETLYHTLAVEYMTEIYVNAHPGVVLDYENNRALRRDEKKRMTRKVKIKWN